LFVDALLRQHVEKLCALHRDTHLAACIGQQGEASSLNADQSVAATFRMPNTVAEHRG